MFPAMAFCQLVEHVSCEVTDHALDNECTLDESLTACMKASKTALMSSMLKLLPEDPDEQKYILKEAVESYMCAASTSLQLLMMFEDHTDLQLTNRTKN